MLVIRSTPVPNEAVLLLFGERFFTVFVTLRASRDDARVPRGGFSLFLYISWIS